MFPGPTILSTRRMVSVPKARAAMAWAPPTRYASVTPAMRAATSTAGSSDLSRAGGDARTMSLTPATRAGTTVISTVDGYAARPPGTYTATRPSGRTS